MALPETLGLIAALGTFAGLDAEVAVRAEGRASAVVPSTLRPEPRAEAAILPSATVLADAWRLRLITAYAPRVTSSDLVARPAPSVDHLLSLRLQTHHAAPWRAEAAASAFRGATDPLADPLRSAATTPGQYGALRPIPYEWLNTRAAAAAPLGPRTTLGGGGSWIVTRAQSSADGGRFPTRLEGALEGSVSQGLTARDTLLLATRFSRTTVVTRPGDAIAALLGASAALRRRLTASVEAWGGGGAVLVTEADPWSFAQYVLPTAEAGIQRTGPSLQLQGAVRLSPQVDAYSGETRAAGETTWALTWRATTRLSLRAGLTAGTWLDGTVSLGGLDTRLAWAATGRLTLEAGLVGRGQHDRRADFPSFVETAVVVAAAWRSGPPATAASPSATPTGPTGTAARGEATGSSPDAPPVRP